jgi:type I restriction-modification system DNA methylase subunit
MNFSQRIGKTPVEKIIQIDRMDNELKNGIWNINRITDILRRDNGISGAMHYTEQISWILFLKFLSDYESNRAFDAQLDSTL